MYCGMANAMGDPYTVYMNEEQMQNFITEANGSLCGVGIIISSDKNNDTCIISDVLKNSPAEKAGLKAGDKIISVDGNNISGLSVSDISALTKGKNNTKVVISIYRDGLGEKSFEITRSMIDMQYVKGSP